MEAYAEKAACPARQPASRDLCLTEWKVVFTARAEHWRIYVTVALTGLRLMLHALMDAVVQLQVVESLLLFKISALKLIAVT